jgi:hypothetical protein
MQLRQIPAPMLTSALSLATLNRLRRILGKPRRSQFLDRIRVNMGMETTEM